MRRSSHLRSLSLRVGFDTRTLAYEDDSLVRVSRRVVDDHYASILADARTSVPPGYYTVGYNTPRREPHSRRLYPPGKTDAGLDWKSALGRTPDD